MLTLNAQQNCSHSEGDTWDWGKAKDSQRNQQSPRSLLVTFPELLLASEGPPVRKDQCVASLLLLARRPAALLLKAPRRALWLLKSKESFIQNQISECVTFGELQTN